MFTIWDQNRDGCICIDEYTEAMKKLSKTGQDEAVEFLFRIFDYNGSNFDTHIGTHTHISSYMHGASASVLKSIYDKRHICQKA